MGKRIIKFRAWDGEKKEMLSFPNYVIGFEHEENVIAFDYDKQGDYYEMELMQFTGLPDKKGKEIWESDIVKIPEHYDGDMLIAETFCEVVFEDGMFCAKGNGQYDWYSIDKVMIDNYEIEVVGNAYETPNILEQAGRQN